MMRILFPPFMKTFLFCLLTLSFPALGLLAGLGATPLLPSQGDTVYDARIEGREILTPRSPAEPRLTGAAIFGVRPGKPVFFRVSATGEKPILFTASGLPAGLVIDPSSGWITGRAPGTPCTSEVQLEVRNSRGLAKGRLTLRVGETICLTPPMGWNSWYVHSEGVSDKAIREIAVAMERKGLVEHGWSYVNIDDCWMGLRDPKSKAIQPNGKFGDMKALVAFVHARGLKLGVYSTTWMSTFAGCIGGSAPDERGDYSEYILPKEKRQNPHQVFGRYPNGIRLGLARIGPAWFVDRDARQFADWGVDYVKYDWVEWTLKKGEKGFDWRRDLPIHKSEAVAKRVHDDFRALDRDIVISFSPEHHSDEEGFITRYCNLWRLTQDIEAKWPRLIAPFAMEERLRLTKPGCYGDLDMLQIGPLGRPNRADIVFTPSPLLPAEQYFQVTLWCMLTQPLLLSCNIETMDAFDLNLVTNDEVLAVDQDPLCRQAYRVAHQKGVWEIWVKELADGGRAVALFNLSDSVQVLSVTQEQVGLSGKLRDLWRQKNLGPLGDRFSASVSPHGVALVKVTP
jgi:alpha-galactosidase